MREEYKRDVIYTFRLPAELWREFKVVATQEGYMNMAEALRSVIRQYVYEHKKVNPL